MKQDDMTMRREDDLEGYKEPVSMRGWVREDEYFIGGFTPHQWDWLNKGILFFFVIGLWLVIL